ncbi:hypothetical protein ACPA9J_23940 [Pseudomonas aeruginosa]
MAQYERPGLLLDSHELLDHLPLYLEYLAQLPEEKRSAACGTSRRSSVCSARACSSAKVAIRCCSSCC